MQESSLIPPHLKAAALAAAVRHRMGMTEMLRQRLVGGLEHLYFPIYWEFLIRLVGGVEQCGKFILYFSNI